MTTRFPAFLDDLDNDLKVGLQTELRALWTHHSTAIEGSTLTLALLSEWLKQGRALTETDLFRLHRLSRPR